MEKIFLSIESFTGNGLVLMGDTVFEFNRNSLVNEFDVKGGNIHEKIAYFCSVHKKDDTQQKIYVDDEDAFDPQLIRESESFIA